MAADLIFFNGPVFLGTGTPLAGQAVTVNDGRISALIPVAELPKHSDEQTVLVDLDGALLSPGFQDAHIHPIQGGIELLQCNLSASESREETLNKIGEYAASHPDEKWILGGGWSMDHFESGSPLSADLDTIVPDPPVLLSSRDHHSVWANSAAMRAAGITANTPDPVDGRIERDEDGVPTGTFHEGAEALFEQARPKADPDLQYRGLLAAQEEMLSLGITGWQDALIGGILGTADALDVYERALDEGALQVHVRGAQWWWRDQGAEQIDTLVERRERIRQRNLTTDSSAPQFDLEAVKIMVDGVAENFTAAMTQPYRDAHGHLTDNSGLSFVDPEDLKRFVGLLGAEGFNLHFHALGDRAVREALDALDSLGSLDSSGSLGTLETLDSSGTFDSLAGTDTGGRHHLAHLQVVAEEDVPRFAQLGAAANIQALWACHEPQLDELTLPFLADDAEARHYPFGELERHGARLVAGSDWPVSSADPLQAIHVAVNRVSPGESGEPLGGAQQQLSLASAFEAYTASSAWINGRERDTGRIAPEFLANLVVIQPNPFAVPASEIYQSHVVSTWVAGEQVAGQQDKSR